MKCCPTCQRPFQRTGRMCASCDKPIRLRHKWHVDGPYMRHDNCANPEMLPEAPVTISGPLLDESAQVVDAVVVAASARPVAGETCVAVAADGGPLGSSVGMATVEVGLANP